VTTDELVTAELADANPLPEPASPPSAEERAEAERVLRRVLDHAAAAPSRRRGPRLGMLAPVVSLLVVVVVAAVVLRTGGSSTTGTTGNGGLTLTLSAAATPQTPRITAGAMSREIMLIRRRLASLGHGFTVRESGAKGIVVTAPRVTAAQRVRIVQLITAPARLRFYDWEASVLTPNGHTAAQQLDAQDATALAVSQGTADGPGFPGAGSASLYDAVTLAARQPPRRASRSLSRLGSEYYLFGAPGSAACAPAAAANGTRPVAGTHCLLAGPLDPAGSVSRPRALGELAAQLPTGVTASEGQVLVVPQGTVVVQAEQFRTVAPVAFSSPTAQFFVLKDTVALTGNDITNPQPSTDQSGQSDVTFGFTRIGQAAFQHATQAIAHRGASVSLGGATLDQHFAAVVDDQLVTVPQINYRQYPDGIIGGGGADITGGFTTRSARDLATELRHGALPLALRVVP
jgi:SecD/SecF fusion protein